MVVGSIPTSGSNFAPLLPQVPAAQRVARHVMSNPILRWSVLLGLSLFAACDGLPPPVSWLRFTPQDMTGWTSDPDGRVVTQCGPAVIRIDFSKRETRIEMEVENRGDKPLRLRAGSQTASPTGAIGEVWRRPLSGGRGEDVPDAVPYLSRQNLDLDNGWRAIFYLDSPLGRDMVLGQQLVFEVEVEQPEAKVVDRAQIPLVATNTGQAPSRR